MLKNVFISLLKQEGDRMGVLAGFNVKMYKKMTIVKMEILKLSYRKINNLR